MYIQKPFWMKLPFKHYYYLSCPPPLPIVLRVFRNCICLVLLHQVCFPHSPPFPLGAIFGLSEMDGAAHTYGWHCTHLTWKPIATAQCGSWLLAVGCKTRCDFRQGKTFFSSPCPGHLWSTLSLLRSLLSRQRRCGSQDVYSPLTPSV